MTREGRAETREAKRTEQTNQESKSGKAAGFSSTSQKGNIVHGKLKSQKELKKITGSEDYKKSDYEGKTKMLNVATANKGMSVKQKKIAAKAPPPNVFNEKDLAVLREEKAKGRGMGLQDESKKPGKIYKAKRGMSFSDKMKAVEDGKINKKTGKPTSMAAMREMKGFKPGESASEFMKRRKELGAAGKALSATRIGKIVLPIAAAGVAAQQYLQGKMKKDKNQKMLTDFYKQKKPGIPSEATKTKNKALNKLNKKMGGGMMQKPMGYSKGGGYDSGTPGKLRDYSSKFNKDGITYKNPRVRGPEESPRLKKLIKKREALGTAKSVLKTLSSVASPIAAAGSAAYKLAKKMKDKDRLTDRDIETARSAVGIGSKNRPIKKDHSSRNPNPKTPKMMGGGMMMQRPMGYNKGVMVKARGCKLGRTRPTKIT